MCAHKLDVSNLHPVRKGNDKPVLVACNVEDHPVVASDAGVSVLSFDIAWRVPVAHHLHQQNAQPLPV